MRTIERTQNGGNRWSARDQRDIGDDPKQGLTRFTIPCILGVERNDTALMDRAGCASFLGSPVLDGLD